MRRRPLLVFYALVALLSWGVVAPLVLLTRQPVLVALIAFTPAPAAFLAAALTGGQPAVRDVRRRAALFRVAPSGYALALALPLGVHLAAAGVSRLLGADLRFPAGQILPLGLLTLILAVGEEIGWRGFALPRLLARFSPLATAVLFGALHAAFHLPMFLLPLPLELRQASPFWLFTLLAVSYSIPGVWLYHCTRGSVPAAVLYHAAINLTVLLLNGASRELIAWLLPASWAIAALLTVALIGPSLQRDRFGEGEISTHPSFSP